MVDQEEVTADQAVAAMEDVMIEEMIAEDLAIETITACEVAGRKPFNIFRDSELYSVWIKQNL